jgi:hypothetical protein
MADYSKSNPLNIASIIFSRFTPPKNRENQPNLAFSFKLRLKKLDIVTFQAVKE